MGLRERLFNTSPCSEAEVLYDRNGKKFWYFWETHFGQGPRMDVWHLGRRIGTIESIWNDEHGLDLADVIIFPNSSHLRGHGLGKEMMKYFIRHVRKLGARFIWGFIQAHEGSSVEYLREWYACQGFQVSEAKPGIYHVLYLLDPGIGKP